MKINIFTVLAAAFLATVAAGELPPELSPPPGPPGAVMKTLDEVEPRMPISQIPFTISEPGSYYLTGNLTGMEGENGITIEAGVSNVTIDLMGFTLQGVEGSLFGISSGDRHVRADNISVVNGVVTGFEEAGVFLGTGVGHLIERLHVSNNGRYGIRSWGSGTIIRNCTISENEFMGIFALAGGTLVESCTVIGNGGGIDSGGSITIKRCYVSNNKTGISAGADAIVIDTIANLNEHDGITVSIGSKIRNAVANRNGGDGIRVIGPGGIPGIGPAGQRTTVTNSNADQNGGAGILVSRGSARIEGNHVSRNQVGLLVESANNLIVKNSAAGNTDADYSIAEDNDVGPIGTMSDVGEHPWANFAPAP
jgi:parallel beta-helix repeat protein